VTNPPTLFVSGANGKLGRRVVELLLERGYAGKIVAGSRNPDKLGNIPGVEIRKADYADRAGFTEALRDVDRVLLISTDVVGEVRQKLQASAVAAAKAAGVKHVVYTSMPNPEPGNPVPLAADHYATERAIKASGVDHTILRVTWYAENLLGSLPSALAMGKWFTSSGEGTIAHVAREDVARAAAGALLAVDKSGTLTVTGPTALTTREIAAIATGVTGKPIEVVDVTDEQLEAGLRQAGLPADVAALLVSFDVNQRNGGFAVATDAVEQLWGTKPQPLREFLEANKAALTQAA
jgi:NAD(P)H dehydrogenase (quinone)